MSNAKPTGLYQAIDRWPIIGSLILGVPFIVLIIFLMNAADNRRAELNQERARMFNQCLEDHKEYECVRIVGRP